jgi:hypothetical protein
MARFLQFFLRFVLSALLMSSPAAAMLLPRLTDPVYYLTNIQKNGIIQVKILRTLDRVTTAWQWSAKSQDEWINIHPGQTVVVRNFCGAGACTGNLRAQYCDEAGVCEGRESDFGLFEWTSMNPAWIFQNLSAGMLLLSNPHSIFGVSLIIRIVRGLNVGITATFGAGSTCKPRICSPTAQQVKQLCLKEQVHEYPSGNVACRSQCAVYGDDKYCCTGPNTPPAMCPPSFRELMSVCGAYTFASDDSKCRGCDPGDRINIALGDPSK